MSRAAQPARHYCPAGCYAAGYRTRASLRTHLKARHARPVRTRSGVRHYGCPVSACRRRFAAAGQLCAHLERAHGPAHARTTRACVACGWTGEPGALRAHMWRDHSAPCARAALLHRLAAALPPLPPAAQKRLELLESVPPLPPAGPVPRARPYSYHATAAAERARYGPCASEEEEEADGNCFTAHWSRVRGGLGAQGPAACAPTTSRPTTAPR